MLLPVLDGVGEGGRCGLGVRCPRRKGLHVGKSAVSERPSYIPGEVDRRAVRHETRDNALSVSQGGGIGKVVEVKLWLLVGKLSKELVVGALEAADTAHL